MTASANTIIYPVTDLAKAKTFFSTLLGVQPESDEVYYVGFNVDGQEIGLDPYGHSKGMTGPVCYWDVEDIETSTKALTDSGAEVQQEAKDVGGGKLIATVQDADGNVIGLIQSP